MRKRFELNQGCMAKAFDHEPTFVLLARDIAAPAAIREWCRLRCLHGKNGAQDAQITEALAIADVMQDEQQLWHLEAKAALTPAAPETPTEPAKQRVTVKRSQFDAHDQVTVFLDGEFACCNMLPIHAERYANGLQQEIAEKGRAE